MTKAVLVPLDFFLNPGEAISTSNTELKEVYIVKIQQLKVLCINSLQGVHGSQ